MPEFLVRVEVELPVDHPDEDDLRAAELKRGRQLRDDGTLLRIWRLPARRANISLYQVRDATELHDVLTSLPLWPWMSVEVWPLARHSIETND